MKVLEIGSYQGRSTLWFLEHVLTDAAATIICVDPFVNPGCEAAFDHNVRLSGSAAKVTKKKGRSEEILPTLSGQRFDIIYVDGSHLAVNVLMDAFLSWSLLNDGGVIVFDDYEWKPERGPESRPKLAIDIFVDVLGPRLEVLHRGYQLIVRAMLGARPAQGAR